MQILGLFPTPVGIFNLDRDFTTVEKTLFLNLSNKNNTFNKISKDQYVLNNVVMADLKKFIESCIDQYVLVTCGKPKDFGLKITKSWCNYTKQGEEHHSHIHPHSYVSGVLYLQTNPGDNITFYRNEQHHFMVQPQELNTFSSSTWTLPTTQGSLILFPSYLEHSVDPKKDNNMRISLSFNTFPIGTIGIPGTLQEMHFS